MEMISKKCLQEIHSNIKKTLQIKNCPKSTKETRAKHVKIVPNFLKDTQPTSMVLKLLFETLNKFGMIALTSLVLTLNMHSLSEGIFS